MKNSISSTLKNHLALWLSGWLSISLPSCGRKIDSTEALMKEISSRYNGKWFTHITFSQTADTYENDSLVMSEIWDEAYHFPSHLVIYMTPGNTSNRYICRNDSVLIYENGVLTHEEKATHDEIILSMDIFNMTYNEIMHRLGDLRYDTGQFHETTCNGRKVYVMGACEGDTSSCQAWFDAEHLYLVKTIKPTKQGIKEEEILDYVQLERGWIGRQVVFKLNGKVYMREKYFNISINE